MPFSKIQVYILIKLLQKCQSCIYHYFLTYSAFLKQVFFSDTKSSFLLTLPVQPTESHNYPCNISFSFCICSCGSVFKYRRLQAQGSEGRAASARETSDRESRTGRRLRRCLQREQQRSYSKLIAEENQQDSEQVQTYIQPFECYTWQCRKSSGYG